MHMANVKGKKMEPTWELASCVGWLATKQSGLETKHSKSVGNKLE